MQVIVFKHVSLEAKFSFPSCNSLFVCTNPPLTRVNDHLEVKITSNCCYPICWMKLGLVGCTWFHLVLLGFTLAHLGKFFSDKVVELVVG